MKRKQEKVFCLRKVGAIQCMEMRCNAITSFVTNKCHRQTRLGHLTTYTQGVQSKSLSHKYGEKRVYLRSLEGKEQYKAIAYKFTDAIFILTSTLLKSSDFIHQPSPSSLWVTPLGLRLLNNAALPLACIR